MSHTPGASRCGMGTGGTVASGQPVEVAARPIMATTIPRRILPLDRMGPAAPFRGLDFKQDVAGHPALLHEFVGFGDARERQAGTDVMYQSVGLETFTDTFERARTVLRIQGIDDEESHAHALEDRGHEGYGDLGGAAPVDDEIAPRPPRRQIGPPIAGAIPPDAATTA